MAIDKEHIGGPRPLKVQRRIRPEHEPDQLVRALHPHAPTIPRQQGRPHAVLAAGAAPADRAVDEQPHARAQHHEGVDAAELPEVGVEDPPHGDAEEVAGLDVVLCERGGDHHGEGDPEEDEEAVEVVGAGGWVERGGAVFVVD
ncbi:hypothetical protein KEM55_001745 [Ascosphaera atra]|nr:hypothetical protein KEM55_001745 [Ascosphaera atra]